VQFIGRKSLVTLALLLGANTAAAQTAAEIVANHTKAVDPQGVAAKLPGIKTTANFEIPAMGMSASLIAIQRAPNQSAITVGLPGIGEMRQGFDGTTAWASDPMQGSRLMAGTEAAAMSDGADFRAMSRPADLFTALELAGEGEVDGQKCIKVKHTWKSGRTTTDCFSTSTWLILETVATQTGPQGEMETVTRFSDYRNVGGVMMPHKTKMSMMGMEQLMTITSVEIGEQPAAAIEPPAEVKALKKP
jgi:zinc protease